MTPLCNFVLFAVILLIVWYNYRTVNNISTNIGYQNNALERIYRVVKSEKYDDDDDTSTSNR